jgi:hypothetical protein
MGTEKARQTSAIAAAALHPERLHLTRLAGPIQQGAVAGGRAREVLAALAQPLAHDVAGARRCCLGPWGLLENPVTATRWLARKAAAASLMLGMAPPCSFPAGTADAAPEGSCPTATSAPYPAEEGPTVPTKAGPSALGRRWSQAENKGA